MKILLINNYHYLRGGTESVYFNTAKLLTEHGHSVIFFSQRWEKNIPCEQEEYFPNGIAYDTTKITEKILGIRHYFYNHDAAEKLTLLLQKEQPDIAHTHLIWGALAPAILKVLHDHNIPIVSSVHEYRMICPAYTFKNGHNQICELCKSSFFYHCIRNKCADKSLLKSIMMASEMYIRNRYTHPCKYINSFIHVSQFCMDKHLEHDERFRNANNFVLYNFTNIQPLSNLEINKEQQYYLYYGRLSQEKGIETLIKAFGQYPTLLLKIVGTGPLETYLKNYCSEHKLSNIHFLGFKQGNELTQLVQKAHFVCVPSEWYENNPMTIIESYTLGVPVIGAKIGGITEIIQHQKTGFLFNYGSCESLQQALQESINLSGQEYIKMKKNAQQFAFKAFNREEHFKTLIDIYEQTIIISRRRKKVLHI